MLKGILLAILLLPSLAFAKPVKYAELSRSMDAIQYTCTAQYCYVRVYYYFVEPTSVMVTCVRLLNQPIGVTDWTGVAEYKPQANMTTEPLSAAELALCNQ